MLRPLSPQTDCEHVHHRIVVFDHALGEGVDVVSEDRQIGRFNGLVERPKILSPIFLPRMFSVISTAACRAVSGHAKLVQGSVHVLQRQGNRPVKRVGYLAQSAGCHC